MAARDEKIAEVRRLQKVAKVKDLQAQLQPRGTKNPDILGTIGAGVESLGRSASFGLADTIGAATDPLVQSALQKIMPKTDEEKLAESALQAAGINVTEAPTPDFRERLEDRQQRAMTQEEEFPVASTVGGLAGALTGGTAVAKGAGALAKGLLPGTVGAVSKAAQGGGALGLGARVLGAAGEGAAQGAAAGLEQAIKTGDTGNIKDEAVESALISGAFPVAGAALKVLPKKFMSSFLGAKEKAIEAYSKNADRIDNAKNLDEISDMASDAIDKIHQNAVNLGEDAATQIRLTLEELKQSVINGSKEAYEILEKSGKTYSKKILLDAAEKAKGTIKRVGGATASSVDDAAIRGVDNWLSRVKLMPDEVSARDLKVLLQGLDNELDEVAAVAGRFNSVPERTLKTVRRSIDQRLKKDLPEYAEKMKDVHNLTELNNAASEYLGKVDQAEKALTKIGAPGKVPDAQQKLLKRVAKRGNIDLERVRKAAEDSKAIKSWGDASIGDKLKSFMSRQSEAAKEKLRIISEMSDTDLLREAESLAMKTQFEQEFLRGSRNVVLWTALGAAGMLGSDSMSVGGMTTGAVIGGLIDRNGPRMTKNILRAVSRIKGIPTVRKVSNALDGLPQNVKDDLLSSFRRTVVASEASNEAIHVPVEARKDIANEIRLNRSLSALEKAKLLSRLNKRGEITDLHKIIDDTGVKIDKPVRQETEKPKQQGRSAKEAADYIRLKRKHDF